MSQAVLDRLAAVLDETEPATKRGNLEDLNRLNREFHLSIYREAGMPTLLQMLTDLRDRYAVYSRLAIALPDYTGSVAGRPPGDLRRLSGRGEAELAAECIRRHIEAATEEMLERLPWSQNDAPDADRDGGTADGELGPSGCRSAADAGAGALVPRVGRGRWTTGSRPPALAASTCSTWSVGRGTAPRAHSRRGARRDAGPGPAAVRGLPELRCAIATSLAVESSDRVDPTARS